MKLKTAHYLLIIVCIITVSLVWEYDMIIQNRHLDYYNNCLDTASKQYCDSIILNH